MAEKACYLAGAARGPVQSLSGQPRVAQVEPVLKKLLDGAGVKTDAIQEIHWLGGDDEFWLSGLGRAAGFAPGLARFQWPAVPLLAHTILQSAARVVEAGEKDLVILAQEAGGEAELLLLASQEAVQNGHLVPIARIGFKRAVSAVPDGLLPAAQSALAAAGQPDIQWLAAARQIAAGSAFSAAQWLYPGADLPSGDLFLFSALAARLAQENARYGLLVSEGPQKSGLVTLLEVA